MENLETNPKTVPTGQMVLQYTRPFRHANIKTINNEAAAIMNVGKLFIHISVE
jgi:hypothetical protein